MCKKQGHSSCAAKEAAAGAVAVQQRQLPRLVLWAGGVAAASRQHGPLLSSGSCGGRRGCCGKGSSMGGGSWKACAVNK